MWAFRLQSLRYATGCCAIAVSKIEAVEVGPGVGWRGRGSLSQEAHRMKGHIENFNGELMDEELKRGVFDTPEETRVPVGRWRNHFHLKRPYGSRGNLPPPPRAYPSPFLVFPLIAGVAFGPTRTLVREPGAAHAARAWSCLERSPSTKP